MPGAQPWLLGVANVRGNLLPIVDLKQFLEGERTVLHESQRVLLVRQPGGDVAVLIDELYGQRSFNEQQQVEPMPKPQRRSTRRQAATRISSTGPTASTTIRGASSAWTRLARTPEFRQAAADSRSRAPHQQQHFRGRTMSTVMDSAAGKGRNLGVNTWLVVLGVSVLIFGLNTGYATWKAARLGGASSSASDLQVNSQKLAVQGREAVGGDAEASPRSRKPGRRSTQDVEQLNDQLRRPPPACPGPIETVADTWGPLGKSADQVIASETAVLALAGNADSFTSRVPQLQARLDELVRAMSASGSPSSQVYIALRQVVLSGTMAEPHHRRSAPVAAAPRSPVTRWGATPPCSATC